jgi:probable HAF family extracellular repeat protein
MIRHHGKIAVGLAVMLLTSGVASSRAAATGYTITDLGVFSGGYRSYAQGINNLGDAVGQADARRVYHAFLYKDSRLNDLGTLGGSSSYARGVNDVDQVVGYSLLRSGVYRAFLYNRNRMIDLGTLGGSASFAYAIQQRRRRAGRRRLLHCGGDGAARLPLDGHER